MSDDLAIPYEDLWYIKLINETDKNPLETWGGYSQDFETAENVYSHSEVAESPHENWGVVGIRGDDRYLLIFDLDVHKAPEGFDPDSIRVPTDTAIVRSQSGGLHVYSVVDADGEGKESDFEMTYDLGWDIDIRGSYVKHHVVAPADIPGAGGKYELTNDETLLTVQNPADVTDRIRYLDPESEKDHGEALLKHAPASGFGGTVAIDRDVEPPEEMPPCYHRGLQVRAANPDDPNVNTHKVNTLTALCGLSAGYDVETMVTHFCEDFPPGANADVVETEYQLKTMARKMDRDSLAPPSISTLREYGILEDGETCACDIEYHGGGGRGVTLTDGGTVADTNTGSGPPTPTTEDGRRRAWNDICDLFRSNEKGTSGEATQAAAKQLLREFDLVTIEENDKIWRYNPETGTFSDDGVPRLRKRLADGLNFTYSRSRVTDILHRVRSETYVKRDSLGAPENHICVSNGVLDLTDPEDPELLDHSPEYRFTWAMNAPYDPDAEATEFRTFLGGSVRPEDIPKLQEYAGDALRHWKQPRNLCVLIGPTDAGKGVFMRVLRAVFDGDNVASETLSDLTDTRWGAYSLYRRPINLANELSTGTLDNPEKAKNFSGGGDTISAENKGEEKFEMTPTANHLFATNQVPQVSNADEAFYNRWLFVTFPTSVPTEDQDDTLDTRMIESDEERAGILNWMLEGYARRQSRPGTGFDTERSIAEKEDMWSAYGNSIDRFISTCLTTDDATDDDSIAKKDAYAVYKTMCNAVGVSVESQQKLTAELKKEEGVDDGKRKVDAHFDDASRSRVFTGVQYSDDGETYLSRALDARQSAEARAETDEEQTGLSDAGTNRGSEIAQGRAVRSLLERIEDMTDEGRGEPVPIEDVTEAVVHRDERARHLIRNQIKGGALLEEPEGHVLPVE